MTNMKKFTLFAAVLVVACNLAPKEGKTFTFNDVGWTMTLPSQMKVVDSAGVAKINQKGKALMEQSTGAKLDISTTRTLITARKGAGSSYFTSTITPFDPQKDGGWDSSNQAVKELIFKTFTDQMPDAALDSASGPVKVGGLDFDRYRITISIKGKPLFTMFLLSKLYKGYDFGISYLYTDDQTKSQMESILASSKFQ